MDDVGDATDKVIPGAIEREKESGENQEKTDEIDSNVRGTGENESQDEEDTIDLTNQWFPSSMGITFFIAGDIQSLHIQLTFGTYRVSELEDYAILVTKILTMIHYRLM